MDISQNIDISYNIRNDLLIDAFNNEKEDVFY